jgi:Xaa-Pro aminopeptidase
MRIFERSLLLPGLPGTEFEIAEKILDPLRMIKDPEDVDAMRQACRIEEDVAVTSGGVDVLTAYPRELQVL